MTVEEPIETDTTPARADTTDLHSPSDTELSSAVLIRPEQATDTSPQSVPNLPFRKTYLTRNSTTIQSYQPAYVLGD